jgi:hypothetical protein
LPASIFVADAHRDDGQRFIIVFRPVSGAGMAVFRGLVVSFVVSQPII